MIMRHHEQSRPQNGSPHVRKVSDVGSTQGQVVANGAFALFSQRRADDVSELLESIFGRDDITAIGADWRGIVYFTLDDDEELAAIVGYVTVLDL